MVPLIFSPVCVFASWVPPEAYSEVELGGWAGGTMCGREGKEREGEGSRRKGENQAE